MPSPMRCASFSPRVNRLPLTPERVLAMIDDGGKG